MIIIIMIKWTKGKGYAQVVKTLSKYSSETSVYLSFMLYCIYLPFVCLMIFFSIHGVKVVELE